MKLQDFQCSKCSYPAHIPFSVHWSDDDCIALATEKGAYITILQSLPKSKNPIMHTERFFISCSKACPTENCGIDINEIIKDFDQHQMYQLVQDITLSPVFKNSSYSPSVKQIAWSPVVVKHKLRCLLAMLTDSGSLSICYNSREEWQTDSSLSLAWFDYCSSQWGEPPVDSNEILKELKKRAYKLKLSAFAWGPVIESSCYLLVTGAWDGTLTAWKVYQDPETKNVCVQMLDVLASSGLFQNPVTALYFQYIEGNSYIVTACYLDGRIITILITITPDSIKILSHNLIWEDADRIQVYPGGLLAKCSADGQLLIVNKGPYLLIFHIGSEGELKKYDVVNSQELLITGLTDFSPTKLLVMAYSGSMYVLNLENPEPELTKEQSSLRGNHYSCNGLALSKSKTIAVIPYSVKTNYDHLTMKELCHLLWCSVAGHSELMSIISAHTGPLSTIWDAIGLLRIELILNNNDSLDSVSRWLGELSIEELDTMEIESLKKNLAIMRLLQLVDLNNSKYTQSQLASIEEEVQELIMSCHVFKIITNATSEKMTKFQSKSFYLMKKWLEYIISKYQSRYNFTTTTASTLLEEFNMEKINCDKELCKICGEEIPTFTGANTSKCPAGHEVPRCCLSLVQCGPLAYYKCFNCDVIAHPGAVSDENNCCIYCDNTFKFTEIFQLKS
ncbi:uncharacterized protein [Halyomorpha halys]|uniref:uncharacterized protein isoform X1 n=1 Tax=Halyomorpha halys TaxID=286706 RepID=UPI0006D4E1C9|nr:uncharacterized protein LOC106678410 isoform X1 [Halyomorpha halys]